VQQVSIEEAKVVFPENDGPEQLEPRLWRIPLPLPFALRSVNVYLIGDHAGRWTMVDAGLGAPADEAALRAGLAIADVTLEQLDALILTHAHPDHIGMAKMVQEASGAPVYMLADEINTLYIAWGAGNEIVAARLEEEYAANGLDVGAPDILNKDAAHGAAALQNSNSAQGGKAHTKPRRRRMVFALPPREVIQPLADGQHIAIGGWAYQAIWTPGHSDYHLCLLREDGLFIAGDHVLPGITPNIGLYPNSRPNPLLDYFGALERVKSLDTRLTLPGHGLPFPDLVGRAEAIRQHHIERGAALLALVREHPTGTDAATLARELFGARLRSIDDYRFALVETLAHLEYLRADGHVERVERMMDAPDAGTRIIYRLA